MLRYCKLSLSCSCSFNQIYLTLYGHIKTAFFICSLIVLINTYQCAKFQLSSSIKLGDIEGGSKIKCGAADLPRRPLADKFLYRALVLVKAYKHTKFQLPSSISF